MMIRCCYCLFRLYRGEDQKANLHSLLTLRRVCDQLLQSTEDHFRIRFLQQTDESMKKVNPYFVVATQVCLQ